MGKGFRDPEYRSIPRPRRNTTTGWRVVASAATQKGCATRIVAGDVDGNRGLWITGAITLVVFGLIFSAVVVVDATGEGASQEVVAEGPPTPLFLGEAAFGPWQRLGSLPEITHPDAADAARLAHDQQWLDPQGEPLPDRLWNTLAVSVTDDLLAIGRPLDRPFADAGADRPNTSVTVRPVDDVDGFAVLWSAGFSTVMEDRAGTAYFGFVVDDAGEILAEDLLLLYEDQVASVVDADQRAARWLHDLVSDRPPSETDI